MEIIKLNIKELEAEIKKIEDNDFVTGKGDKLLMDMAYYSDVQCILKTKKEILRLIEKECKWCPTVRKLKAGIEGWNLQIIWILKTSPWGFLDSLFARRKESPPGLI